MVPRYPHSRGSAGRLLSADAGLVRARVPGAHRRPGSGLARDRARRERPHPGTDGLREDACGISLRHRSAEQGSRRGSAPPLRLSAQGPELRHRAQSPQPASGLGLDARRGRPHRRHPCGRATPHAQVASRHPDHDARIALLAPHVAGSGDADGHRDRDPRRGPRRCGHQARGPPRAVVGAPASG